MVATITLTYPFSPDDTALLNKLLGNPGGTVKRRHRRRTNWW